MQGIEQKRICLFRYWYVVFVTTPAQESTKEIQFHHLIYFYPAEKNKTVMDLHDLYTYVQRSIAY